MASTVEAFHLVGHAVECLGLIFLGHVDGIGDSIAWNPTVRLEISVDGHAIAVAVAVAVASHDCFW